MQHWIGTSGFQYPEWKGSFYPEKMPASKMLPYYAERFPTTEINYSFRRIPSKKTISDWSKATPPEFKFTFKAPQKITHFARLRECTETLEFFCDVISELNEKLGAILFQLPPDFEKDAARLNSFLQLLPRHFRSAFEFRHASWFDDEIFSLLRERNVALCIAESEKLVAPAEATADFGYLRLRREDYTEAHIARWAIFVRAQKKQWSDVFIYFKHEESGVGPKFAQQMANILQSEIVSLPLPGQKFC